MKLVDKCMISVSMMAVLVFLGNAFPTSVHADTSSNGDHKIQRSFSGGSASSQGARIKLPSDATTAQSDEARAQLHLKNVQPGEDAQGQQQAEERKVYQSRSGGQAMANTMALAGTPKHETQAEVP